MIEQFSAICGTKCAILVLEPEYYNLINIETVKVIYDIFMKKIEFRNERYNQSHLSDRTMSQFAKKTLTGVEKVINTLIRSSPPVRDELSKSEHSRRQSQLPRDELSKSENGRRQSQLPRDELSRSENGRRQSQLPDELSRSENGRRQSQLPPISNNKMAERQDAKAWWDTNELVPGRSLEEYNMLFHNLNDPIMVTGTMKGSDRAKTKVLESIPTTIEDVTIRFKGKVATELQDDGYCAASKKGTPLVTARSDDLSTDRSNNISLSDYKPRTPGRANRSFLSDAAHFLQNGLQGL